MSHDEIRAALGAFALHALDEDEWLVVARHLEECQRCAAEVRDHRETVTLLGYGGSDAPTGLWSRIQSELRPAPLERPCPPERRPRRRFLALAGAAVALLALGVQLWGHRESLDGLTGSRSDPAAVLFDETAARAGTRRFVLTSADGALEVPGLISSDGRGILRADGLPVLPVDRSYQLWGAIGDRRVSLGLLGGNPAFVPFDPRLFSAFAITEEDAEGAKESIGAAVVSGGVS